MTGPNGAGKSTLLRAIAGFLPLAAGAFALEGGASDASIGEQAHYLGHVDALKGALTAARTSRSGRRARAAIRRAASGAARSQRLGLAHVADLPVRALSAGQKRRVALARLLVAPRPLWLLDEPTTALDAAAQGLFAEIMREHLGAGGLIVAATHAPLGLDGAHDASTRRFARIAA